MDKKLLTISEFIECYSISRTAFYREVAANRLAVLKRGRRTLIAEIDAERWVKTLRKNTSIGARLSR